MTIATRIGMRGLRAALLVATAGCTAPASETAPVVASVDACRAAVAAHVGKDASAVTVAALDARPDGTQTFEAVDILPGGAARRHVCEVGPAGNVRRIEHPAE